MRTIRILAGAVIALIALYFVFRAVASACSGAGCDVYIPISALVPLLIVVMALVTGIVATVSTRHDHTWFTVLLGATVLAVLGPIVALLIFRDNPDVFVVVATILVLLVPVAALAYTFIYAPARGRA